jgi:uncharacterized protein YybS (DUF2232 family)
VSQITHREPQKEFVTATAITTLIAMAGLYLPVLGFLVSVFVPLPLLFYRAKLGRSQGALLLIAVTLIVASMMGQRSITATAFFFELGLVGLILSEVFAMNLSVEKTVAVTTAVVIATGGLLLALYGLLSTNSLWGLMSDYLQRNLELALAIYKEMEVSEERIAILAESMEGILYIMLRIMPAIVIVSTLFVVWSNLLLARPLLRGRDLFCPDFGTLNEWKAPEPLVWLVIVSGVLVLMPNQGLKLLGINGLIIMMMIYFFQGIAIVSFYFDKKQFPRLLRGVLYGLIALQQLVLLLVIAAGFLDMWVDFRRMKNKGVENQDESHT